MSEDLDFLYVSLGLNLNLPVTLADFFSILLVCCHNDGISRIIRPGYYV